jgi:hypothetical protein
VDALRRYTSAKYPPIQRGWSLCSNALPTGLAEWLFSPKKRRVSSTTPTSAPSTSCSASSTKVKESPPRHSTRSASRSTPCVPRWRRSSVRADRRLPATSPSRRARRRFSSCHCARRCSSATTTSALSTSCSACCARARVSPPRCSRSWVPTSVACASRSSSCSPATRVPPASPRASPRHRAAAARPQPHPARTRQEARPRHRPCTRARARHADPLAPHQEQPGAHR